MRARERNYEHWFFHLSLSRLKYSVYILYSQTHDRYYVGQTNNLENRIERHNNGYVKSTKAYRPWIIVYTEEFLERTPAVRREAQIKAWKSKKMILKLVDASRSGSGFLRE
ncbi:MAG: GIY-YIG nuclease family protein [Fluviicola sp.]